MSTEPPGSRMHATVMERGTLRVAIEPTPPLLLIALEGELDYDSAGLLRRLDVTDVAGITSVVVDLTDLTFSDSTGMRALLELQADQQGQGRDLRIVNASPWVRRLCRVLSEDQERPGCGISAAEGCCE